MLGGGDQVPHGFSSVSCLPKPVQSTHVVVEKKMGRKKWKKKRERGYFGFMQTFFDSIFDNYVCTRLSGWLAGGGRLFLFSIVRQQLHSQHWLMTKERRQLESELTSGPVLLLLGEFLFLLAFPGIFSWLGFFFAARGGRPAKA